MYGGENSGMPLGPDPVNSGTGTFGADNDYDQPAAIVSGGEDGGAVAFDSNNKNSSAKYFGRRSREKATKSSAPQMQANAEFIAANNIANNPNNPDFFREAAANNATSSIQRQPRQINKKPFIIVGALILVAVIGFAIYSLIPKPTQEEIAGDLSEVITQNFDGISYYELKIQNLDTEKMNLSTFKYANDSDYEALKSTDSSKMEMVKKIQTALKDRKNSSIEGASLALKQLEARIAQYEKYNSITYAIIDAMRSGDSNQAEQLLAPYKDMNGMSSTISIIKEAAPLRKKVEDVVKNNNCREKMTQACINIANDDYQLSALYKSSPYLNDSIKNYVGDTKDGGLIDSLNQLSEISRNGEEK